MALQTEGKWNGNRVILASCESFRKQALVRDVNGTCSDGIAHGIASVYCDPKLRGRGYASRLLRELSRPLPTTWQTQGRGKRCIASVLFSDIGPKFYQSLGWEPFPSYQLEFQAGEGQGAAATPLYAEDLAALCEEDEAGVRRAMAVARSAGDAKPRAVLLRIRSTFSDWWWRTGCRMLKPYRRPRRVWELFCRQLERRQQNGGCTR
ncbi:hypothetical protein P175DRAFT_0502216 [Aspergillus ochraceoroseus IBT 24754]|uniref:N-acetyltransferase domain-containing protein n=1 Tax=Aspergillus ochraceoroseus IBT 24754 TaxID=1392256 RepID=A0A2T5LUV6_9EURO|nr:uncharacterized protein P175DRAFT_0502216 [Aspergillus ochraceoroseus IBT 24754]PTU20071.1 hypothetical protein P175DRAFT_0502216 [Aspergillus ochraceoroseus IBT 24754]